MSARPSKQPLGRGTPAISWWPKMKCPLRGQAATSPFLLKSEACGPKSEAYLCLPPPRNLPKLPPPKSEKRPKTTPKTVTPWNNKCYTKTILAESGRIVPNRTKGLQFGPNGFFAPQIGPNWADWFRPLGRWRRRPGDMGCFGGQPAMTCLPAARSGAAPVRGQAPRSARLGRRAVAPPKVTNQALATPPHRTHNSR